MPTSASCPRARASKRAGRNCAPRPEGFTLVEILVVLAIAGLLATVVLPQLVSLAASIEAANQRKDLRIALENLGYEAYAGGKQIVIEGAYPAKDKEKQEPAPFPVPEGWRIEVQKPIQYSVNGVCSGGRIAIVGPDRLRESFALKAPKCRLEPVPEAD